MNTLCQLILLASYCFLALSALVVLSCGFGVISFRLQKLRQLRAYLAAPRPSQRARKKLAAFAPLLPRLGGGQSSTAQVLDLLDRLAGSEFRLVRLASASAVRAGMLGTAAAMIRFLAGADQSLSLQNGVEGLIGWMQLIAPAFWTTAIGLLIALLGGVTEHFMQAAMAAVANLSPPPNAQRQI